MNLDFNLLKKHSIGKYFRKIKHLYKSEPIPSYLEPSLEQQELILYLKSIGLKGPKIDLGLFHLKNGLSYSGLIAKELLLANEVIFSVPREMILDARIAYFSEIRVIFEEHMEDFILNEEDWDYYLILFFILFEYQKGKESNWYHLIINLPKNQGFLALWTEEELSYLEDDNLKNKAIKEYMEILTIYERFNKIVKEYPWLIKEETFSLKNFLWIYSILTNRIFYGGFKFVSLIPFVDMLNHEKVNIFRRKILDENDNENRKQEEIKNNNENEILNDKKKFWTNENEDNYSSSEESFEFEDEENYHVNDENQEFSYPVKNEFINRIFNWFEDNVDCCDLTSSVFFCKLISDIEENPKDKIDFNEKVLMKLDKYLFFITKFYSEVKNIEYFKFFKYKSIEKIEKSIKINPFDKKNWDIDNFKEIQFVTKNENFEKNSQIYLNYGNYSNKKLLQNYGMSIEYNKSDKVFLNINPFEFLNIPGTFQQFLKRMKVFPYFYFFKLKYTKFNYDMLIFFKTICFEMGINDIEHIFYSKNIDLEIKSIEKVISFLQQLKFSINTIEENEKLLYDKTIGYNQYFSIIYKLEKQRITNFNIMLYKVCLQFLQRIRDGETTSKVWDEEINFIGSKDELLRYKYVLRSYISKWDFEIK